MHRDLKPANVLLASDGARLADFGIARLDLEAATRKTQLTRADAILVTFPYMSPEQRAGRPVDARSDLYSVGVMLYEALAGERPEGAFPPLHRRRSEVPSRLDQAVLRLLQPDPKARFASATESKRALLAALKAQVSYKWPLAGAAGAAALALIAVYSFRALEKPLPSQPKLQSPAPTKQAARPPEPPAEKPAANSPVQAERFKQEQALKLENAQVLAKKKAGARAYTPKSKVGRKPGWSGAKDGKDWLAPLNQAESQDNQQALPPPQIQRSLQSNEPSQAVSPASNAKSAPKPSPKSMGKKGSWNDDLDFGTIKK